MTRRNVRSFTVEAPDGVATVTLGGRDAWALRQLTAGERGRTPIDDPGPRWSAYVHKLRRAGIAVETRTEAHGGAFAGRHARYILRSRVTLAADSDAVAA